MTARPGERPGRPKLTESVSGMMAFQSCRRRWLLGRQWTKPGSAPALWFGDGIHKGLEGYFSARKDGLDEEQCTRRMKLYYLKWYRRQRVALKKEFGILWEQGVSSFNSMVEIGWNMLKNYVEFDKQSDIPLKPLMVEKLLYIPLGDNNFLSMKWDLAAETDAGMVAIVDHKTSSGRHATGQTLDVDEQMTSYAYGYWKIMGKLADLIIYDVLHKETPAKPRILKNGQLSIAKNQATTYALYMEAIRENDLDPDDYEEILDALQERGWSGFFEREASPRSEAQVRNFEKRARIIFEEMRAALHSPDLAYPSPSAMKCPHCPYLSVCNAMEDGSDYKYLLELSFKQKVDDPWKKNKHTEKTK